MVRLILPLLLLSGISDDYEVARLRMQELLRKIEQVSQVEDNRTPECQCNPCTCDDCKCGEVIEPPITPVTVTWLEAEPVVQQTAGNRAYMITAVWCGPCRASKEACGDLIGEAGSGSPVEIIDVEQRPRYAAELGIRHAASIPTWIIVDANGNERIRTTGSRTRASLTSLLQRYSVATETTVAEDPMVVADISTEPTVTAIVAATTEHLIRNKDPQGYPVGGLFNKDLSVPEQVPAILATLMAGEPLEISEAGLSVSWTGAGRQVEFTSATELEFKPPINVRVEKWGVAVKTILSGLEVTDSGRIVKLRLKGPDFTIRFQ